MANNTSNVTWGKPAVSGGVWWAPAGTTLPTDATTALGNDFVCLGYCSEDGLTNSNTPETDTIKAWGGDEVLTIQTGKPDHFSFTLIEPMNVNTLKAVYGDDNVTGTLATGITVKANGDEIPSAVWVFEMILKGGGLKRIVVPIGDVSELGEITYRDNEAVGYNVTINALPGGWEDSNDTHREYIKKTA